VDAGGADVAAVKVGADAADAGTAAVASEMTVDGAAMGSHAAAMDAVVGAVEAVAAMVESADAMGVDASVDVAGAGSPEATVEVSVGLTRNSANILRTSAMRNRVEGEISEGESMVLG
jgi:hypothetical protein